MYICLSKLKSRSNRSTDFGGRIDRRLKTQNRHSTDTLTHFCLSLRECSWMANAVHIWNTSSQQFIGMQWPLGCHLVICDFFTFVKSQHSAPKFVTFDKLSLYTKLLLNWLMFRGGRPVALNGWHDTNNRPAQSRCIIMSTSECV